MKICLIIYKIDPVSGSENASGYNLAKQIIQKYPETTLISRCDNIQRLQNDPAFKNIRLIGLDVPKIFSFYKKKSRGIIIYYYLWQYLVGRKVKQLDKKEIFSVIHQINFHTDWAPHFLKSQQARIIWGPIGHHAQTPYSWFLNKTRFIPEIINRIVKFLFWTANPWLRCAMKNSDIILFANSLIPYTFKKYQHKIKYRLYAGSHWPITPDVDPRHGFNLLFVGRLVPLKGIHIALDAFAYFLQHAIPQSHCTPSLTIIGTGEMNDLLQQKVKIINQTYGQNVRLLSWLEREELQTHYQQADYFLYPSLEAQGLVVSEAISQHCLPITLSGTGPAAISQMKNLTIQAW